MSETKVREIEEWRPIPGWEEYEASSNGRIRKIAYWRKGRMFMHASPRELRPHVNRGGYRTICLWRRGKTRKGFVSRMVLMAFTGTDRKGLDAAHENGIKQDDRISNLSWKTKKENQADKRRHGTYHFGERVNGCKLKESNVRDILRESRSGIDDAELGRRYGVCRKTIFFIRHGITWRHIPREKIACKK